MSSGVLQNLASGNAERRDPGFLVVEHNGRKVAIGRNPNYQETIASIRDNVHELKETPSDRITILAHLEEVDDHVQITKDWRRLVPLVCYHHILCPLTKETAQMIDQAIRIKFQVPQTSWWRNITVEELQFRETLAIKLSRGTVASIKKNVRALKRAPDNQIILLAHLVEVGDNVQVTEDVWPDLLPTLLTIQVELDDRSSDLSDGCFGEAHLYPTPSAPPRTKQNQGSNYSNKSVTKNTRNQWQVPGHGGPIFVQIDSLAAGIPCTVNLSTCTGEDLKNIVQIQENFLIGDELLTFNGRLLETERKLADYGVQYRSILRLIPNPNSRPLLMGKPVIYLYPPKITTDIQVGLSLNRSWAFSAIYPPTAITAPTGDDKSVGQAITWTVDAQPDGVLWDHATRREVSYLFWEAHTNPKLLSSPPITRPSSPVEVTSHFDPTSPTLLSGHSALLPFDKVTGYIDDVLVALGLHTEARTSFITYWLPDLSKHTHIALRFLPQDEYEKAAPLNISPMPEVMTRVFMLFRGVEESQIELWNDAMDMARMDVSVWKDIVGVDTTKVHDTSLFRVLEWGGMEVK
ncbi:unnamed protein product [Rhizoctonia solani]|uniref:Ubiquitin-like domain-containing protein n=1 Tax=Rhizoctonia solani TaxID=456999 RepID=A0A8H3HP14_9AGAM|nr:unnamed protein product [Rhizoctonia solani]